MEKLTLKINKSIFLSEEMKELGFDRKNILKIMKNKDILINGARTREDLQLEEGDEITIFYSPSQRTQIDIVYVDENVIIINKPFGIEVEGQNSVCHRLNALAVHRLDRNTTGLLILAKNKAAQQILVNAFKEKKIIKKYYAEVEGKTDFKNYTFNAFLVKDDKEARVKIFTRPVANSQKISTTFNTVKNSSSSLIECQLHTGKTHQIRASLAFLGHPIIGDGKYGKNEINKKYNCFKQRLHAYYIKFPQIPTPLENLSGKSFTNKPNWMK